MPFNLEGKMNNNQLISRVRAMFRDIVIENKLMDSYEYSEDDIISASVIALSKINTDHIYQTGYTVEDCPEHMLVLGTAYYAMQARVAQKIRNKVTINDGGVIADREGNTPLYISLMASMKQEFEESINKIKGWADIQRAMP